MNKIIYADCNGSHPPLTEVKEYLLKRLQGPFANPNALHGPGRNLHAALEKSRTVIANYLGAKNEQLIFTSGATEAINSIFHGIMPYAREERRHYFILSAVEHPAVIETAKRYEAQGFSIKYLKVNHQGLIDTNELQDLLKKIGSKVALVAIMAANNETGILQPYEEIAKLCQEFTVPYFCDTTQLIGKLPFHFENSKIDFVVMSSHKVGGLPGSGVLLVKKPTSLDPMIQGGGQEYGHRSGTQNYLGIECMAMAMHVSQETLTKAKELEEAKLRFEKTIKERFKKATIIGETTPRLPGTTAISYQGVHGQAVQIELESHGVFVTTSSACGDNEPFTSHVLKAMHFSDDVGRGVVRFSLSNHSDFHSYEKITEALSQAYKKLSPIGHF